MSSETTGAQDVPERRDPTKPDQAAESRAHRKTQHPLGIPTGARYTSSVEMLVIEAELKADGRGGPNWAIPTSQDVREEAEERIADADLVPAWIPDPEVTTE